jgi:acyl-CoA thioesterase
MRCGFIDQPEPINGTGFAMHSHGLRNGRGLVSGECINANGEHIATISQELLLRQKRSSPV